MKRMLMGLMLAASVGAGAATATAQDPMPQTPPDALTWMLLNEINSAYFQRTEPFNRPAIVTTVPDGVIVPVDISHDGTTDWLVDYTDSGLIYCGTGGCLRTLYVSHDGDYVQAFNQQVDTFVIGKRGTETVIDATVHQVFCTPTDWDCAYSWAWDQQAGRLVERANAKGGTLLTDQGDMGALPRLEEHDALLDSLPAELATIWRTTRVTCPTTNNDDGITIYRATFDDVPDLNGDGARDWIVYPPSQCAPTPDQMGPPQGFAIYLSGEGGTVTEAYRTQDDRWAAIDIATTPAMLVANPECGLETACPNPRLRWDRATARFVSVR